MKFEEMTKAEIVDYLASRGIKATTRPRKAVLVELAEHEFAAEMAENIMEEKVMYKPWWKKLLGI